METEDRNHTLLNANWISLVCALTVTTEATWYSRIKQAKFIKAKVGNVQIHVWCSVRLRWGLSISRSMAMF